MSKFQQVAKDIQQLLKSQPQYDDGSLGPLFVRLAWHASGTYCARDRTGGSNGATMRFFPEASDDANRGLDLARAALEPLKVKHTWISYADLWTLAGVVAIQEMGGPTIEWIPGRTDAANEKACPVQGRLPDAHLGAKHLKDVFYRMGFSDQEIVALSGAHTLGRCHKDRSGFIGPWTYTPTRFSNQYFVVLLKQKWKPVYKFPEAPMQYENEDGDLMMLPTDMALLEDPEFKKWVEIYAADKQRFFNDFAKVFSKLLHFNCPSGKAVTIQTNLARV